MVNGECDAKVLFGDPGSVAIRVLNGRHSRCSSRRAIKPNLAALPRRCGLSWELWDLSKSNARRQHRNQQHGEADGHEEEVARRNRARTRERDLIEAGLNKPLPRP